MREITLPSGAVLKLNAAPFSDAKRLYQVLLEHSKGIPFDPKTDAPAFIKEIACNVLSSPGWDQALGVCMKRCSYNNKGSGDMQCTDQLFEALEAREDYMTVCIEVAMENLTPFLKGLFAALNQLGALKV